MTKYVVNVQSHGKPDIDKVKKACERFVANVAKQKGGFNHVGQLASPSRQSIRSCAGI